ncbi:hypothetical protein ATN83_2382 [Raoultella ornithinolytica]|nr:hypothetical protein ATN83_2382 [Raoultella ornithinolytica]
MEDFCAILCKNEQAHFSYGDNWGEKLMDTDLKFSLTTTIIVLGLIVAAGLTAVLH